MLSNYAVYNQEIRTNMIEILQQDVEAFNEASDGAIMLSGDLVPGDFLKEASWKSVDSALRDVDAYAALAAAPVTQMANNEVVGVKKAGAFGPVAFKPADLTWLDQKPEDAIVAIATGFSNSLLKYQLNTAISATVGALANQADSLNDLSASAGITHVGLNSGHAKFGDASQSLVVDIMSGASFHKLKEKSLQNAEQLFQADNVTVQSILGKKIIVTDAPALFEAGTPNKAKVLSLTSGAVVLEGGNDIVTNIDTPNGQTRLQTSFQADFSFTVKIKGYAWDEVVGGKSPMDAEIATGTNWLRAFDDVKNTAGVVSIFDAAL